MEMFIKYWILAGIIYSLIFIHIFSKKEDYEDLVRDIRWNTGIPDEGIFYFTFGICLVMGFWLLPCLLVKTVYKRVFNKK